MYESIQTIDEFFEKFEGVARKFRWRLKGAKVLIGKESAPKVPGPRLRTVGAFSYCPIEAMFEKSGAFTLSAAWDSVLRLSVIYSSDNERRYGYFNKGLRDELLRVCGVNVE